MKTQGLPAFILLLRILSGYSVTRHLILLMLLFSFTSDFYFQPSDPLPPLTLEVLSRLHVTKKSALDLL